MVNDNVNKLGNVSKLIGYGISYIIYSMFNKHKCQLRKRLKSCNKVKVIKGRWKQEFVNLLNNYKSPNFSYK